MRRTQQGNAVIFILIAIALFAALAYTFIRGARTGQGNLTAGQARLAAQSIINYSTTLERGIDRMMRRGCSQDELSMERAPDRTGPAWNNTNAAPDNRCHLFEPEGGNVSDQRAPSGMAADIPWAFSAEAEMCADTQCAYGIAAYLNGVSAQVCREINIQVGNGWEAIPTNAVALNMSYNPSVGGTSAISNSPATINCTTFGFADSNTCLKDSGCYTDGTNNLYYSYIYRVY